MLGKRGICQFTCCKSSILEATEYDAAGGRLCSGPGGTGLAASLLSVGSPGTRIRQKVSQVTL